MVNFMLCIFLSEKKRFSEMSDGPAGCLYMEGRENQSGIKQDYMANIHVLIFNLLGTYQNFQPQSKGHTY